MHDAALLYSPAESGWHRTPKKIITTAVKGGDASLGDLLETSIGVFQILGTNSSDSFSWGGTLNTSHKHKTAYVNVKQRYEIE